MKYFIGAIIIFAVFVFVFDPFGQETIDPSDSCAALDGAARDDCYAQKTLCSKVVSNVVRDTCIVELATLKGDAGVCDLIQSDKAKAHCQEKLIILAGDVKECSTIEDIYWQDNCYNHFAFEQNDHTLCWEIAADTQRHECVAQVAETLQDPDVCMYLPTKPNDKRAICLFDIAQNKQSLEICEMIETPINQDSCKFRIAKRSDDSSICKTLKTNIVTKSCEAYFA